MKRNPIVRSSFGAADRKFAAELFRKGIALEQIEKALLLGVSRNYIAALNSTPFALPNKPADQAARQLKEPIQNSLPAFTSPFPTR